MHDIATNGKKIDKNIGTLPLLPSELKIKFI